MCANILLLRHVVDAAEVRAGLLLHICSMELRTLEGDSKAIGTDDSKMSLDDDEEDDAVQMQKCAAVLFGFSGDLNAAFSAAFQQPLVPAPQQVLPGFPHSWLLQGRAGLHQHEDPHFR